MILFALALVAPVPSINKANIQAPARPLLLATIKMPEPQKRARAPWPSPATTKSKQTGDGGAPPRTPCAQGCLTPVEAISFADNVAPKAGIAGEFDMTVMGVGEQQGRFYLNSEADYRERNCLTIAVAANVIESMFGTADLKILAARFKGQRIAVQGIARRVRIDLTANGKPTGNYYYQVHVVVTDPRQIVIY